MWPKSNEACVPSPPANCCTFSCRVSSTVNSIPYVDAAFAHDDAENAATAHLALTTNLQICSAKVLKTNAVSVRSQPASCRTIRCGLSPTIAVIRRYRSPV